MGLIPMWGGLRVVVADAAIMETEERLFPVSRHRSKRIRKKLMKRFGGEYRKKPAAYQMAGQLFVHPAIWAQLRERIGREG